MRTVVCEFLLIIALVVIPVNLGAVPDQSFAFNPVFIPFGTINAEYEHALFFDKTTMGAACWYEFMDVKARWLSARVLYYPFSEALDGFGIGVNAGVMEAYGDKKKDEKEKDSAAIAGLIGQYNWLLGLNKQYLIGVGIGCNAVLKNYEEDSAFNKFETFVRLVTGFAF